MSEPLVFNQPLSPPRTVNIIGRLNWTRAIRHGIRRIGDVAVKRARAGLCRPFCPFWRIEREFAVRVKIELAIRSNVMRRPLIVTLPFIRPGLERDRFSDSELAFIF